MAGPLSTNVKNDDFGFAQIQRDIEMLYLLIGQSRGDMSQTAQPGWAGSLGLTTGVYNPAKVEVGSDGNILSIGAAASGGPISVTSAFVVWNAINITTGIRLFYPWDPAFSGDTVFSSGVIDLYGTSGITISGSGSSSCLTGFNTSGVYQIFYTLSSFYAQTAGSDLRYSLTPGLNTSFNNDINRYIQSFAGSHSVAAGTNTNNDDMKASATFTGQSSMFLQGSKDGFGSVISSASVSSIKAHIVRLI